MLFLEISLEGGPVWIWLINSQMEVISFTSLMQLPIEHSGVSYNLLPLTSVPILFPFTSFPVAFFHFPCNLLFCVFLNFFFWTGSDENVKRLSSRARKRWVCMSRLMLHRLNWYHSSLGTCSHVIMLMERAVRDCQVSLHWQVAEPRDVFHFLTPFMFSGQPGGGWALLKPLRWISPLGPNHCLESYQKVSGNRSWVPREESSGSWVGRGLLSISEVKGTARGRSWG